MIRAIKWVDEVCMYIPGAEVLTLNIHTCITHNTCCTQVAEDVPYSLSLETLDKYNCDFVVHGGMCCMYVRI